MKRFLWPLLTLGLLALIIPSIFGLATGPDPTLPNAKDATHAARALPPPPGSTDFRNPIATLAPSARATTPAELALWVGADGVIEPTGEAHQLGPNVSGQVAEVFVRVGERVTAGQALLRLDDAIERAQLATAEAELRLSTARLAKVTGGTRPELIAEAINQAREVQARAALAAEARDRAQALVDAHAETREALDRAQREAAAAAFSARAARARRDAAVRGNRPEDIAIAQAEEGAAEARLAEAQARLDARTLRAPEPGEILQILVKPGEFYRPGESVALILGDTSRLVARLDVDERDLARVTVGADVEVRVPAYGARVFPGTVTELGRRMGKKNLRTDEPTERNDVKILEVLVTLTPEAGLLIPGQRVTGLIRAAPEHAAEPPTTHNGFTK